MAEETSWTEERLEKLKNCESGLSISQIGEQLGVTRNAVAGKAHRLKLPKRQSPISKTERQNTKELKQQGLASASRFAGHKMVPIKMCLALRRPQDG